MTAPIEWLSKKQAAQLLQVSERTIDRLTAAGTLRRARLTGGIIRFSRKQIEELIARKLSAR